VTSITIPLPEDRLAQLHDLAARQGVSPEELARQGVEQLLERPSQLRKAADYVLEKNAELYRRLAR